MHITTRLVINPCSHVRTLHDGIIHDTSNGIAIRLKRVPSMWSDSLGFGPNVVDASKLVADAVYIFARSTSTNSFKSNPLPFSPPSHSVE